MQFESEIIWNYLISNIIVMWSKKPQTHSFNLKFKKNFKITIKMSSQLLFVMNA